MNCLRGGTSLYKAMPKKGEETYLFDDAALTRYRAEHKGNFTLQRYKGLGEMDAQQLWETTLNPESRTLKQISFFALFWHCYVKRRCCKKYMSMRDQFWHKTIKERQKQCCDMCGKISEDP